MRKGFAGGSIFATTHGSEPWRVVALPGWMHTVADFDRVLGEVATTGIGSVAVDLPGFGGTADAPPEAWGSARYAEWLAPLVEEIASDGRPPVVVGHSFGGRVAVHLAAQRPELVAALVLTGVPLLPRKDRPASKPALAFRVARSLHRRGLLPDERMEAVRRKHGSADYRAASGVMRDVLVTVTNESYEAPLRSSSCPITFVWGSTDDAAPLEVAQRAATMVGERGRLMTVDGVGHQTPLSEPAIRPLSDAIVEAVAATDGAGR